MKKLLIVTFFTLFVSFVFVASVSATITGKCAKVCSFGCDCGKDCTGKGCSTDAQGNQCCPYCQADCEAAGLSSYCPAGCDCETKTIKCACGNNGGKTCFVCGGGKKPPPNKPPGPTDKPPEPTKPPATPTPVQPTIIKNIPLPSADAFDQGSGAGTDTGTGTDTFNEVGKYWICLDSKPCNDAASGCSGNGNKEHRVKIETKKDTQLKLPNTPTYVLECVAESAEQNNYQCTTGNQELDGKLLLKGSHLQELQSKYGYAFVSYTDMSGNIIDQSALERVPKTTQEGKFGPYEWESYTSINAWRLVMSMQYANGAGDSSGNMGALQQAATTFIFDKASKDCVIIQWDPRGVVYDVDTGKPLEGVQVTLYKKNPSGNFEMVKDSQWSMIANPVLSSKKGRYQFLVPAGTYKIEVSKKGYVFSPTSNHTIADLYNGGDIVTDGGVKVVNIGMKFDYTRFLLDSVSSLFHK